MNRLEQKKGIAPSTSAIKVDAPTVARKARAGQFVVVRVDERGARIPLTIAETYPMGGLTKIIFQDVGLTTKKLR
jgi:ferredoxin--NADP+ reductase